MSILKDRTLGERPWQVPNPLYVPPAVSSRPIGVPETALEDSAFWWWIEGNGSSYRVMCVGAHGTPFEVQNSEYPDQIWDRITQLDPSVR